MYTCHTCQKSYNNKGRYESHVQRCGRVNVDDDLQSVASNKSETSIVSNYISDVEGGSKKGSRLNVKLKKYNRELQRVKEVNRDDMEKSQEYFHDQILNLTDERDKLAEDLFIAKDKLFYERGRMRDEFNRKLISHKEQLENRYSAAGNKYIKRLKDIIDNLQNKLDSQLEEKEKVKESLDKYYSEREEKFLKDIEKHQEEMQTVSKTFEVERTDLTRIMQACVSEKESYMTKCDVEKNKDIQKILLDKRSDIRVLEKINISLESRLSGIEEDKDKEINRIKTSHKNNIATKDRHISEINARYKKTLEETTKSMQCRIDRAHKEVEKAVQESSKKHIEKLQQEKSQHDKIIIALKMEHKREIENMDKDLRSAIEDVAYQKKFTDHAIERKEKDMLKQFQTITNKLESEILNITRKSDNKYNESVIDGEKTINKLKNDVNIVEHELNKQRMYSKKVEQDSINDKKESDVYITNKKREYDKIIMEKDKSIREISSNLKNKIKLLTQELNSTKRSIDSQTEECASSRREIQVLKNQNIQLSIDIARIVKESNKTMKEDKDKIQSLQSVKSELDIEHESNENNKRKLVNIQKKLDNVIKEYESRIEYINNDYNNKIDTNRIEAYNDFESKNIKLQNELDKVNGLYATIKDQTALKFNVEIEKVRVENINKINSLMLEVKSKEDMMTSIKSQFNTETKRHMKLNEQHLKNDISNAEEIKKLQDTLRSRCNELALARSNFTLKMEEQYKSITANNNIENNRLKARLEEKDKKIAIIEKDNSTTLGILKRDYTSKINTLTKEYKDLQKERNNNNKTLDKQVISKKELVDIKLEIETTKTLFNKKLAIESNKYINKLKEKDSEIEKLKSNFQKELDILKRENSTTIDYENNKHSVENREMLKIIDEKNNTIKQLQDTLSFNK